MKVILNSFDIVKERLWAWENHNFKLRNTISTIIIMPGRYRVLVSNLLDLLVS